MNVTVDVASSNKEQMIEGVPHKHLSGMSCLSVSIFPNQILISYSKTGNTNSNEHQYSLGNVEPVAHSIQTCMCIILGKSFTCKGAKFF